MDRSLCVKYIDYLWGPGFRVRPLPWSFLTAAHSSERAPSLLSFFATAILWRWAADQQNSGRLFPFLVDENVSTRRHRDAELCLETG